MDQRARLAAIGLAIAVAAFLAGFLPQWARSSRLAGELEETRFELRSARTEGKIAAALTESLRSNYERSRQLMTEVYRELEEMSPRVSESERRAIAEILAQRDEMVTLLARAAPESSQRLMLVHTRFRAATNPGAPVPAE